MQPRELCIWALCSFAALAFSSVAKASPPRAAMPEPLIGETITDIDRSEAGEVEFDVTALVHRTTLTSLNGFSGALECEYGVTRQLGVALEVGFTKGLGPDAATAPFEPGLNLGAAWALLHDVTRDIHLQLESRLRLLREKSSDLVEFEDSNLAAAVDLRGGARSGLWTLRSGLGFGFGGHSRRAAPLRANLSLFRELGTSSPIGFAGVEVDGDWGRLAPVVVAPTAVFGTRPFRLGVAVLMAISEAGPIPGIMVRLIYEPD